MKATIKSPNGRTRRSVLKAGLTAAAVAAVSVPRAESQEPTWKKKQPGELRISAVCGEEYRVRGGIRPIMERLPNAEFWWANNYKPITPDMINDTDLLLTYYSSYLYNEENTAAIIEGITKRGMGWICLHNTPWFTGEKLNTLLGADCILHREIQPVIISHLNQNHPITQGIEPFVINLDEQFGLFLKNPGDPEVEILFRSQGVHDKRRTIQGISVRRGKGRIVTFTPGHYEWTWYNEACQEILWRSAQWVLNLPIEPFYGNYDNFIW